MTSMFIARAIPKRSQDRSQTYRKTIPRTRTRSFTYGWGCLSGLVDEVIHARVTYARTRARRGAERP